MPGPPQRGRAGARAPGFTTQRRGGVLLKIRAALPDFDLVVRSHGWYDLPPFLYEEGGLSFSAEHDGASFGVRVRPGSGGLEATATRGVPAAVVRKVVGRVFDLERDLTPFHAACRAAPGRRFDWIAERGGGRILRAPTLFEDAVKMLATTNCSWGLTRRIVANLIAVAGSGGAFPAPRAVAALSERRLRDEVRLGYRAPYLARFAERVAAGKLDLSRWEDEGRSDDEVEREIRKEPGFGPYAAASIGRLIGRHARLGLDSWSRKRVRDLHFKGREVPDRRIEKLYAPFGRFAGLAFWLDVTRSWHEGPDRRDD